MVPPKLDVLWVLSCCLSISIGKWLEGFLVVPHWETGVSGLEGLHLAQPGSEDSLVLSLL